ncbi:major facilitator superfamily protein [Eremomyces bilateralis CBS 781.70]|uniref:Major facilitator superfamily protein n=1 Tax=Eremomyces bilateralis CBS 781.70 TaxID=1392243 RepID=A0A6G1FR64_9PEZI|nr:major facilitator superfamily protein [Eremomyces bilateralis CBS 781.70]KAF1808179.1 major facilitator superfamily protein [Eremomyces bilateralis CBS 781.70]
MNTTAVPGTIQLVGVGHDQGGAAIVLHPQPTSDPQDPLNWKPWRKGLAVASAYLYTIAIGIATAVQYSVLTNIEDDTGITLAQLNTGTGLMFLFLGWGNLIWQPIALVYGRRGVYIISCVLAIGPMIWTAYSSSVGEWYAHRILIGICAAPVESLPEVTIPDLFFAHERGTYMGVYAFMLFGANFLAPFFSGFILDAMGWSAVMWFGAIVLAVTAVLMFFCMEETMYFRQTFEGVSVDRGPADTEKVKGADEPTLAMNSDASRVSTVEPSYRPERSYLQKLHLFVAWPERPSNKQLLTMAWRPLVIFFQFPNVTWAGFLYGTNLSWYNVLNATMSLVLGGAPYNFSASMVGTAYLSPFVGASLASVWAGWVGDKVALRLARRNSGIREPEHRLWTLLVSGIIATGGLILWGVGAAEGVHFMGLIFGTGMLTFGVVCGGSTALSYATDCFKDLTGETMVTVIIIRNTLGFGFSYAITPWIENQGMLKCFVAVGMVSLTCTGSFLLMVPFGKRLRIYSAKTYYAYAATTLGAH